MLWSQEAWEDYLHWQQTEKGLLHRVNALIAEIVRQPFAGTGQPEPLERDLAGWWSRRITREHRLVYRVAGSGPDRYIEIAACRYHYRRS